MARSNASRKLHDDRQVLIPIVIFTCLHNELASDPLVDWRLLEPDADVFGKHVRAKVGDREVGAAKDKNERQWPNASIAYCSQVWQWIEAVLLDKGQHF